MSFFRVYSSISTKLALNQSKASSLWSSVLFKTKTDTLFSTRVNFPATHKGTSTLAEAYRLDPSTDFKAMNRNLELGSIYPAFFPFLDRTLTHSGKVRKAAVLVPLCLDNGVPSVLFTMRSKHLRVCPGDVCFPGGKMDPTDASLNETALRETFEEIGIPPSTVQIIGQLEAIPFNRGALEVTPFIGLIDLSLSWPGKKGVLDSQTINLVINKDEVQECFMMPLNQLASNTVLKPSCSLAPSSFCVPNFNTPPNISNNICGLTAHILMETLRRLPSSFYSSSPSL